MTAIRRFGRLLHDLDPANNKTANVQWFEFDERKKCYNLSETKDNISTVRAIHLRGGDGVRGV